MIPTLPVGIAPGGVRMTPLEADRPDGTTPATATVLTNSDLHTVNGELVAIYILTPKDMLSFHKER